MKTVGAYEAKTHLAKLLDWVENGEQITITRRGVPVAVLLSPNASHKPNPEETIGKLRELRRKKTLGGLSLADLIQEGRR